MRYDLLWCALAMTSFIACQNNNNSQKQAAPGFTLTGTLKGIDTGMIKLVSYDEVTHTSKTVDSGAIKDHQFTLAGTIGVPQMASIVISPGNWGFQLFIEDTILSVEADTSGAQHYDYTSYGGQKGAQITKYTETGSKNNDDWMSYQHDPGQKQFDTVLADLSKQCQAALAKNDQEGVGQAKDKWNSEYELLQAWRRQKINEFITAFPSSVAGVYMLFDHRHHDAMDFPAVQLDSILHRFQGQAAVSGYYHALAADVEKKRAIMPGAVAPDFTLLKRDSTPFTLSSLRGSYVMIDFWASWCHPCRQAIPHWKKVYAKYHDKAFNMVSVSDDDKWPNWFKALDQEKMPWNQVCDEFPIKNTPARVGLLYMTNTLPWYVLLDKEGKILVYSNKEEDIDNKLKEIYGS